MNEADPQFQKVDGSALELIFYLVCGVFSADFLPCLAKNPLKKTPEGDN